MDDRGVVEWVVAAAIGVALLAGATDTRAAIEPVSRSSTAAITNTTTAPRPARGPTPPVTTVVSP